MCERNSFWVAIFCVCPFKKVLGFAWAKLKVLPASLAETERGFQQMKQSFLQVMSEVSEKKKKG